MRLLLDTHVLVWALAEPEKLPEGIRSRLDSGAAEVLFSAASVWELAIKLSTGKLPAGMKPDTVLAAALDDGFIELPLRAEAAALVGRLPLHHRDPFDRVLIAQAMSEPAVLCTVDRQLSKYSSHVQLLGVAERNP